MSLLNEIDSAWAVGLLEGEGTFSIHVRKASTTGNKEIAIHCEMTDKDVIERLYKIMGEGHVNKRDRGDGVRKVSWCWSVQDQQGIYNVCIRILPWLGERRTEKVNKLLETIEEKRNGCRTT